jgi:hypothetical protein
MPELNKLQNDYILFSLFDKKEKERIDGIHVSKEPDTRIELLAYFRPLNMPVTIMPLVLPQTPPQRKGFTLVEWGGAIDFGQLKKLY